MKKSFLLALTVVLGYCAGAQNIVVSSVARSPFKNGQHPVAKTTTVIHDSLVMENLGPGDTSVYQYTYTGDSGNVAGTNYTGATAFAERYTFNAADSQIQVIGVLAAFRGTVSPSSTKTAYLKVWNAATRTATTRPTLFFSGFPSNALDSVAVPYTSLGISATSVSLIAKYFATPTAYLADSFFVGFSTNYTWAGLAGDTIGLGTTLQGARTSPVYTIAGGDTTVNVQNSFLKPSNVWFDNGYNVGFKVNYWVFPIVNSKITSGVRGITRNDFTFYGNYPNPAVNSTTFKFALAKSTDVTIQIMNENGQIINTISNGNMAAGEHLVNFETAGLAAGNYLCVFRTAEGDGIASKLTVIK